MSSLALFITIILALFCFVSFVGRAGGVRNRRVSLFFFLAVLG